MSGPLLAMQAVVIVTADREVADSFERVARGLGARRVVRYCAAEEARTALDRLLPVRLFVIDEQLAGVDRGSDFARWLSAQPSTARIARVGCGVSSQMHAVGASGPLFTTVARRPLDDAGVFAALFRCLRDEQPA
jgi:CheY-like chemotaxis protein